MLFTKAGDVELATPGFRRGSFIPRILEPPRPIHQAFYAVAMEACARSVSTRAAT